MGRGYGHREPIKAGVIVVLCAVRAVAATAGINLVGVQLTKPMHGFSTQFKDMFTQENLVLIRFWGGYLAVNVAMAILNFVGVPQPKPIHGFSPNFQDMLTESGARDDYIF